MNNLTRFDNDGIEIFINETGESFASIRGVARMAGKPASTIKRFKVLRNFALHEAQIDTPGGKQGVALLDEDQIVEVLEKYNTSRLKQFAKLGVRVALHQIAGYRQESPQKRPEDLTYYELELLEQFCEQDCITEETWGDLFNFQNIDIQTVRYYQMLLKLSHLERMRTSDIQAANSRIDSVEPQELIQAYSTAFDVDPKRVTIEMARSHYRGVLTELRDSSILELKQNTSIGSDFHKAAIAFDLDYQKFLEEVEDPQLLLAV